MGRDASLDEFLDAGSDGEESGSAEADDEEEDGAGDETENAEPGPSVLATEAAPATVTFDWSPEGGTCADCGGTAERRWRAEAGLVCADCKGW